MKLIPARALLPCPGLVSALVLPGAAGVPRTALWTPLWTSRVEPVERPVPSCGGPAGTRSMCPKSRRTPCVVGVLRRRTSPTSFLREGRDRSETKICTAPRRLVGEGLRWPGDWVAGIRGSRPVDRDVTGTGRGCESCSSSMNAREGLLSPMATGALLAFPAGTRFGGHEGAGRPVAGGRAGPAADELVHNNRLLLWREDRVLWRRVGDSVEDAPETEVCERNPVEPLVALGLRAVELLPRTPSGESGIGRRRRSTANRAACRTGSPEAR